MAYDTIYLKNVLQNQHSNADINKFLCNFEAEQTNWKKYINEVLLPLDSSYEKIAYKIGFSKGTVRKWCVDGELPQNREAFIKLAFALNMDVEQTNRLLTVYGHYSELYAKDINDIITIYIIKKRMDDPENERYTYQSLKYWYERYKKKMCTYRHKVNNQYYKDKETILLYEKAILIKEDEEFEKFIDNNQLIFISTYSGLVDYLETFIKIRMNEYEVGSFHKLAEELGMSARYEKILSNLRQNGILPKRKELIAFGIHLNMTLEEIDILLSKASMRELYVKDKIDCILMYFLSEAVREDPDLLVNNAFKMESLTKDPAIRKRYGEIVKRVMQFEYDVNAPEVEQIAQFVTKSLEEIKFLEKDERDELKELLGD